MRLEVTEISVECVPVFSNLLTILPVFALILTGWIARRGGALGHNALKEVNRLVVYLALPALLFHIMTRADIASAWHPGFIAAFALACGSVFGLTVMLRMRAGATLADAAIDGLNASYANTGFIGFPLVLAVVGESGMAATLVATILTVSVLFAIAIMLIELSLQSHGRRRTIVWRTFLSLIRNPLLIAPVLGTVFLLMGWHLPDIADKYLVLLGDAASPCALIALGLFLAESSGRRPKAGPATEAALVGLKLIGQPLATWGLAYIFGLGAEESFVAVLLAALPTGTGPFMLAELYEREALLTARVVLKTTLLSVITLSLLLMLR